MNIRQKIQAIALSLTPVPTFSYTENREFNVNTSDYDFTNGHVRLVEVEEGGITLTESGGHKDDYILFIQFLKKAEFDNTSVQHDEIIDQLRPIVSKFLEAYQNYRINNVLAFEPITERIPVIALINRQDDNLTGVEIRLTARELQPRGIC